MPIRFTTETLEGQTVLRMTTWGEMISEDIDSMRAEIDPGRRYHGLPQIITTDGGPGGMGKAFRERLVEVSPNKVGVKFPVAIILMQPLRAMALDFILKVLRYDTARVFSKEADAVAWLCRELPAFAQKSPPYR